MKLKGNARVTRAQAFGAATHIYCEVALHDSLPIANHSVDLAIEGWAFVMPSREMLPGKKNVTRWVAELEHKVRPGGKIVLLETMGTGVESPFAGGYSLDLFHDLLIEN